MIVFNCTRVYARDYILVGLNTTKKKRDQIQKYSFLINITMISKYIVRIIRNTNFLSYFLCSINHGIHKKLKLVKYKIKYKKLDIRLSIQSGD